MDHQPTYKASPNGHLRLLSSDEVTEMTTLSRTTLWRMSKAGAFPKSVRLSPGRVGYLADAVTGWITSKREAA